MMVVQSILRKPSSEVIAFETKTKHVTYETLNSEEDLKAVDESMRRSLEDSDSPE